MLILLNKNKSTFSTITTKIVMAATLKKLSDPVSKLILRKQAEYKIEKKRCVSIEQTIDYLIRDAYLGNKSPKKVEKVQVCDATKAQ